MPLAVLLSEYDVSNPNPKGLHPTSWAIPRCWISPPSAPETSFLTSPVYALEWRFRIAERCSLRTVAAGEGPTVVLSCSPPRS
jgi:hypothetical protein